MIHHHQPAHGRIPRVIILGGSGFVGQALARRLGRQGVETVPLTSTQLDLCSPNAVELLQEVVMRDDALVMAAALTPDRGKDVLTTMRNVTMGYHLAAFLQQTQCSHVIYLSSDAVYDDGASLLRETTPSSPATLYGQMHLLREKMLRAALEPQRCPLLVLRPCSVYGADDTHNSYGPNRFLRSAVSEQRIALFGDGEEKRDHVHVSDLCHVMHQALAQRSEGTLNVATGKAVSFLELAEAIRGICGGTVAIERTERRSPVTHRHFDVSSMVRAFPDVRFTPLTEGLTDYRAKLLDAARSFQEAYLR